MSSFSSDQDISKAMIIITDGEDHENAVDIAGRGCPSGSDHQRGGDWIPGWVTYPGTGVREHFMTDNEGNVVISRLNEEMGMEVAQSGQGLYVRADNSNTAVRALEARLDELETGATTSPLLLGVR